MKKEQLIITENFTLNDCNPKLQKKVSNKTYIYSILKKTITLILKHINETFISTDDDNNNSNNNKKNVREFASIICNLLSWCINILKIKDIE